MFPTNPSVIQSFTSSTSTNPVPLFLIHDGGGTTCSYYLLQSLHRPVYGIQNPRFFSGRKWKGGLHEMASVYCEFIKSTTTESEILLGGWSLGGLLSLEMARIFAAQSSLKVLGIVMIDSSFPDYCLGGWGTAEPHESAISKTCKPELWMAMEKSFTHAVEMVDQWVLPRWDWVAAEELLSRHSEVDSDCLKWEPHSMFSASDSMTYTDQRVAIHPPPTLLLRATGFTPVVKDTIQGAVTRTDTYRTDNLLGWGKYHCGLVVGVSDIEGQHFDIFTPEHVQLLSEKLRTACDILEHGLAENKREMTEGYFKF